MRKAVHIVALLAAATPWTLVASAQGPSAPPVGERSQTTPTLALVGCVERIEPPARRAGETAPLPPPAYKLVDVELGGQRAQRPATAETQYLLAAPASTKLSDFQNQRVEVTGTLGITAKPPASEQRGATPGSTLPASTLNVMSVKVVSTECKPPRVTFR